MSTAHAAALACIQHAPVRKAHTAIKTLPRSPNSAPTLDKAVRAAIARKSTGLINAIVDHIIFGRPPTANKNGRRQRRRILRPHSGPKYLPFSTLAYAANHGILTAVCRLARLAHPPTDDDITALINAKDPLVLSVYADRAATSHLANTALCSQKHVMHAIQTRDAGLLATIVENTPADVLAKPSLYRACMRARWFQGLATVLHRNTEAATNAAREALDTEDIDVLKIILQSTGLTATDLETLHRETPQPTGIFASC